MRLMYSYHTVTKHCNFHVVIFSAWFSWFGKKNVQREFIQFTTIFDVILGSAEVSSCLDRLEFSLPRSTKFTVFSKPLQHVATTSLSMATPWTKFAIAEMSFLSVLF